MSFKYTAQKISEAHYVLPKVGSMKVDAHAFMSEELYNSSEESVWSQLASGAAQEGIIGAYLMPDGHCGFGVPIGCVLVTDNTIIQACSGYDIGCGLVALKVNIKPELLCDWDTRLKWIKEVEKRVALGVGSNRPELMPNFNSRTAEDILRYGAKALGVRTDLCERQFIQIPNDIDFHKIEKAWDKLIPQIGSLGGSNHHIELQVCSLTNDVFVMIHCGSRGYGYQTANHFFYEGAKLRGLPSNRREDSWLYLDEPLGKEYWAYHNSAANFSIANRQVIVQGIKEALQLIYNADSEIYYEISHNLVQQESLVLPDGTIKKGLVHRKGATRAFPAGHPDLIGTQWEHTGHPCIVPGSMLAGAAILFPDIGAYQSACSINHGSGRVMARGEAKRNLGPLQNDIDYEMKNISREFNGIPINGIVGNLEHTPLDECGHVYKDLDSVLGVLKTNNIANVKHRLYPVANIKGCD